MPAKESALPLLVPRIRTNDTQHTLASDDAAFDTPFFDGGADFHGDYAASVGGMTEGGEAEVDDPGAIRSSPARKR